MYQKTNPIDKKNKTEMGLVLETGKIDIELDIEVWYRIRQSEYVTENVKAYRRLE